MTSWLADYNGLWKFDTQKEEVSRAWNDFVFVDNRQLLVASADDFGS
jgi:hypothetical protein